MANSGFHTEQSITAPVSITCSHHYTIATHQTLTEKQVSAAMAASILANETEATTPHLQPSPRRSKPSLLNRFGEMLVAKLEQTVDPTAASGQSIAAMMQTEQVLPITPNLYLHSGSNGRHKGVAIDNGRAPRLSKRTAIDQLLELYRQNPQANLQMVSEQIGRTPQTVATYLHELQSQGIVAINDSGVYLQQ